MSTPLVHWLDYASSKPSDIGSYQEVYNNFPINGATFSENQTTIINIGNCGSQAVLDPITSRLQFKVAATTACKVAGTCAGFCKQIQVWYGSQVLETLSNYDGIHTALFDSTVEMSARKYQYSIHGGTGTDETNRLQGASIGAGANLTFSISLLSTCLGALSKNYIPLYMLTSGNLQLRITWNSNAQAVAAAAATVLTYSDIKYVANIVYLNERIISQITSDPITLYGECYQNLQYQVPASSPAINQTLTAPYSSLKTVFVIFRDPAALTTQARYSNARSSGDILVYSHMFGSKQVPPNLVTCKNSGYVEPFDELRAALHMGGGLLGNLGIHNATSYKFGDDDGTTPSGTCVYAQNFESYSGKSGDLVSGIDTRATSLVFKATLDTAAATVAKQMDVYCHFDCQLIFSDGGMTIVF